MATVPINVAERINQLEQSERGITETLRGPGVSQIERLMLYEDRKDIRRELAELRAKATAST